MVIKGYHKCVIEMSKTTKPKKKKSNCISLKYTFFLIPSNINILLRKIIC